METTGFSRWSFIEQSKTGIPGFSTDGGMSFNDSFQIAETCATFWGGDHILIMAESDDLPLGSLYDDTQLRDGRSRAWYFYYYSTTKGDIVVMIWDNGNESIVKCSTTSIFPVLNVGIISHVIDSTVAARAGHEHGGWKARTEYCYYSLAATGGYPQWTISYLTAGVEWLGGHPPLVLWVKVNALNGDFISSGKSIDNLFWY
jgi:hypothetical protein